MDKQEFINRLSAALNGRVAPGVVTENVNYYEEYINMEIRKGRSEEEVLQMLGDPRLIAKTIIETNGNDVQTDYREGTYQGYDYRSDAESDSQNRLSVLRLPGWLWSIIVILVVVLIFGAVLSVLSFLAPVILSIVVVLFLVKLFRDWLN